MVGNFFYVTPEYGDQNVPNWGIIWNCFWFSKFSPQFGTLFFRVTNFG